MASNLHRTPGPDVSILRGILSFLCEITQSPPGKTDDWMARSIALPFGH